MSDGASCHDRPLEEASHIEVGEIRLEKGLPPGHDGPRSYVFVCDASGGLNGELWDRDADLVLEMATTLASSEFTALMRGAMNYLGGDIGAEVRNAFAAHVATREI